MINLSALGVRYSEHSETPGCSSDRRSCVNIDPSWLSFDARQGSHAASHIHFGSLLFAHDRRRAACRFTNWERVLAATPCRLQYRPDVLAGALAALSRWLPSSARFDAIHVRALPEAAAKRDTLREWTARLTGLLDGGAADALYVATDDPVRVLPLASRTLGTRNVLLVAAT